MMKLLNFLTRRDGMTRKQFEDYWLNVHGPLVKKHAAAIKLRKYVQVHARHAAAVAAMNQAHDVGSGLTIDYDGVVELWWDSVDDFLGSFQTPEGKAAWAAISADEPNLADHKRCYTYVGEEIQLLPERR